MIGLSDNEARMLMNYLDRLDGSGDDVNAMEASVAYDGDAPGALRLLLMRITKQCADQYTATVREAEHST
jgi:hypothetical protein